MYEMVAIEIGDAGARRFCRGTRKKGLDRLFYRRAFRGNEAVECSVLKKLKLAAGEILRRKAVSEKKK